MKQHALMYFFWVKIRHIIIGAWQTWRGPRVCRAAWFSVNNSGNSGLFLCLGRKAMPGLYYLINRQLFSKGMQLASQPCDILPTSQARRLGWRLAAADLGLLRFCG
jgi:hypothetical protein